MRLISYSFDLQCAAMELLQSPYSSKHGCGMQARARPSHWHTKTGPPAGDSHAHRIILTQDGPGILDLRQQTVEMHV